MSNKKPDHGMLRDECITCINARWRHFPMDLYYPVFDHCAAGETCKPNQMNLGNSALILKIEAKYKREGRIKDA